MMSEYNCKKCDQSIKVRKECEEMGSAYHYRCFHCCICNRFLSEYEVRFRNDKLYCEMHAKLVEGSQPFCKVYFNNDGSCYRVIMAEEKENDEKEKKNKKEEG